MAAAKVLGLDYVEVMDFQDCRVMDDFESRLKIARAVRQQRPDDRAGSLLGWSSRAGRGTYGSPNRRVFGEPWRKFAHLRALPLEGEP